MPQLNEQQFKKLEFVENYARNEAQEWNSFGSLAQLNGWTVNNSTNRMDVLLLKSLFVLKHKGALEEDTINRVLEDPKPGEGHHNLFEIVNDMDFLSKNENDPNVKEAMSCLSVLQGYFDEIYHENKMQNDPAYAAKYAKEQEKIQKANEFAVIEKHLSSLNGKILFEKNLSIANPDDLMKLQLRDLTDAELDQCEAVYDELFKIPSTGKILNPEKFVARKPMDTNPSYSYHPLCATATDEQNETEEAKKIRLKKGKAEVLRAILDPARQTEYRHDDWGDADVNMFGNQRVVEGRQFLRTTNINLTDTKQWEDAVLKKKAEYNNKSRQEFANVLANPDPGILLLEKYDAQDLNTNEFIYKQFSVQDYAKCIKAAELFDKMFKNFSDLRGEIGFKDVEKDIRYKGQSIYGRVYDVLEQSIRTNGWSTSVIAKAVIVFYLANGNKNLTFKPYEFSKQKPGFLPTLTSKDPYQMTLTSNVAEQANALKAKQEADRNKILQENADAEKAFDDSVQQKEDDEIQRNITQTDTLTDNFVNALNNKQYGLGNSNRETLRNNAKLIVNQNNLKKDSEDYRKSISDNKYPNRNLDDMNHRPFLDRNNLRGNFLIQNYGGEKRDEVIKILENAGLKSINIQGDISSVAIFAYAFGVKGMTVDQLISMNEQQKFALSAEALSEFAKRPITGEGAKTKGEIQSNLAWYGEMVKKANTRVFEESGITFPNLNRIKTEPNAVDSFFRSEKFGFVYEYALNMELMIEDWTNKSNKVSPSNRYGINPKEEFLKGYARDSLDRNSDLINNKAVINSIIGFGDALLKHTTIDRNVQNNPNTHMNRLKMVKYDLFMDQYGKLSGKPVCEDQKQLAEVGFKRRAICEADFDTQTMDLLSKADEKNAERMIQLKADSSAQIPTDLLKDYGILKIASKTAGLHKDFHGSKYILKELENALSVLNDTDKPEILKFDFNAPENAGKDLDFEELRQQEDLLDDVEDTFNRVFESYMDVESLFRSQNNDDDYENLVLFDRFQINGVSVKELLIQKTNINDFDFQDLALRRQFGKAMILHAMADPNAHLTFTPAYDGFYAKPIALNNYTNEYHLQREREIRSLNREAVQNQDVQYKPYDNVDEELAALHVEIPEHMADNQMEVPQDENLKSAYSIAMRFKPYPHLEEMHETLMDVCGTQPDPKVVDHGYSKQEIDGFFANANLNGDRVSTHASDFTFYLMGVKGMSFEEATMMNRRHPEYDQNVKDFIAFVKAHPIKRENPGDIPLTNQKRSENIKAWTDLFIKAYDRFREYRLPNIDFSDPKQFALHQRELTHLAKVGMDYFQEVGDFMNSSYSGEIRIAAGGFEKLQNARSTMGMFNSLQIGLDFGLMKNPMTAPLAVNIRNAAVSRALLKSVSNDIKGKTIADIHKNCATVVPKMSLMTNVANYTARVTDENLNTDKAIQYLRGQNKEYENTFLAGQQERIKGQYVVTNSVNKEAANRLFIDKNNENGFRAVKEELDAIFLQDQNGNLFYNTFITNPDKRLLNAAMGIFQAFDKTNEDHLLRDAYGISLLDSIRIDGKTPAELFGEKYAFIQNPAEKQTMYALEIVKEYNSGNKPITMDIYSFDENGVVYKSGCVMLGKDPATIQRGYALLDEVSKLHSELIAMKQKITSADERASEADRNRLRARNEYNEMMTALDECIEASDVTNNNRSVDKLDSALAKLNQKVSAYTKQREILTINEKVRRNAAPRLAKKGVAAEMVRYKQANDAKKKIPEAIARIRKLAAPLGIMSNEHERGNIVSEQSKFGKIRQYLESAASQRRINNANAPVDVKNSWNNEDDYHFILRFNSGNWTTYGFSDDNIARINNVAKLDIGEKPADECIRQANFLLGPEKQNQSVFDNVGLMGSRHEAVHSFFLMWLMATKGYDVHTLSRILDNAPGADGRPRNAELMKEIEKHRTAFIRFCAENPVKKADHLNDQQYESCIENWANVFMAATEKVKSYTLPDIDYSNVDQVQSFINEFTTLKTLGINFGQEFPRILTGDHANKPAKDVFEEKLRKVGGTQKLVNEWLKMQKLTDTINNAYVVTQPVNGDMQTGQVLASLSKIAGFRYAAGELLNPVKGLTLGEATANYGNTIQLYDEAENLFVRNLAPEDGEYYDYKDSVGFVLGQNREAFLKKAEEMFKKEVTAVYKRSGRYSFESTDKITEIAFGDLRERFNAIDDTAEAMKNFLKENATEGRSIRHWMNDAFRTKIFGSEQYRYMITEAGLKYSDCFLIDGKTPAELWGAKYEGETAEEKEVLLLAEVMRKIAKGDSTIYTKQFSISEDGKIHQSGYNMALEKNSRLEEIQSAAISSYITEKELLAELKEIQKALQDTQSNKQANLTSNDIRTGSDLYQDLCLKLDKCIVLLEKSTDQGDANKVNRHLVVDALNDFSTANETYYNKRKGVLFGPVRDYGQKRLAISYHAYETLEAYSPRLAKYLNNFGSNMVEKNATLQNADSSSIKDKAQEIRTFLGKEKLNEADMAKTYIHDCIANKCFELQGMDTVKIPESKAKNPQEREKYEMAFRYIKASTLDMLQKGDATLLDVRKLDHITERTAELANNPAFRSCMKMNEKKCAEIFRKIENKAENNVAVYNAKLNSLGNKIKYVALNDKQVAPLNAAQRLFLKNTCINSVRTMDYGAKDNQGNLINANGHRLVHERLVEVLLTQILADPSDGKFYRQYIANDQLIKDAKPDYDENTSYNKFKNILFEVYANEKKALEAPNAEKTLNKLESGALKEEANIALHEKLIQISRQARLQNNAQNNIQNEGAQVQNQGNHNQNEANHQGPGMGGMG